jgi:hypothetical protein
MKKYLINYAAKGTNCAENHPNSGYINAQRINSKTGIDVAGFDESINYGMHSLSDEFKKMHKKHFSFTRGAGYWVWKPHIILETFKNINDGDILMYSDSGCHFIHSMDPVFKILENTLNKCLCFQLAQIEESWTKRDCFIGMDCDYPEYVKSKQIMSTFFLCKKNEFSTFIVNEWQKYINDFHMVSDEFVSPSKKENYPDFKEHRHDQSILSLICKKHKVEVMEDITEWGNSEVRGTPQIVAHTRRRD